MASMKKLEARGYIASGEFNGNRVPQHVQNAIIRSYCSELGLVYVLSRAEYWMLENSDCQLWAALREGYSNIVFYSIWQLPMIKDRRIEVYQHCLENRIKLYFASEQLCTECSRDSVEVIEIIIGTHETMLCLNNDRYLERLTDYIFQGKQK